MKKLILLTSLALFQLLQMDAQTVAWAKKYPSLGQQTNPRHISASPVDHGVAVNGMYYTMHSVHGAFVARKDAAGNNMWSATMQLTNPDWGNSYIEPSGMAFNSANELYMGLNYTDTVTVGATFNQAGPGFMLIKYDAGGGMLWTYNYSGGFINDIITDNADNVYVLFTVKSAFTFFGQFFTPAYASDMVLAKLDAAGNLVMFKQVHGNVDGGKVKRADSGNLFVLGSFTDTIYVDGYADDWEHDPYGGDHFIMKTDPAGNIMDFVFDIPSSLEYYSDLMVTSDEKMMIVGRSCWTNGCQALARTYDAAGNDMSDWGMSGPYGSGYDFRSLAMPDASGIWALSGEHNSVNYGDPDDDWSLMGITKYDMSGNIIQRDSFNYFGDWNTKDMVNDGVNDLYITAILADTAQFEGYTLMPDVMGQSEYMIMRISLGMATGISAKENSKPALEVYPNPAQSFLSISYRNGIEGSVRCAVKNVLGQEVFSEMLSGSSYTKQIDLSGQPKGIYFVEIRNEKEHFTKKIILN